MERKPGKIISVSDVPMMPIGTYWPWKTVIYERDGKRFIGCQQFDPPQFYFGGGRKFFNDIDEAWGAAFL